MRDALFANEPLIRLGAFAGVFVVMAGWEVLTPRRPQTVGRNWRWPNNLGVLAVDALLVRVVLPITTVGVALVAEAHGVGLFNMIALPVWASIIVSVMVLDLAIYLQHVLFHAVPALWRLHRMHHADLEVDVTTGLRFHPSIIRFCGARPTAISGSTCLGGTCCWGLTAPSRRQGTRR
jgi:sterol desaturase/sphingolipid hydroxylase (fatty acid hydroxylase superfamily)